MPWRLAFVMCPFANYFEAAGPLFVKLAPIMQIFGSARVNRETDPIYILLILCRFVSLRKC